MLKYIYGRDLRHFPKLAKTMFRDRALQFHDRLKWPVSVDAQGLERDEYDLDHSLYVIWQNPNGAHGGSMRFLPTEGATMINDHFSNLLSHKPLASPTIWECTRFCLSPQASPCIAAALMLAGLELGLHRGLTFSAGVFDARMIRIYQRLGWSPVILGTSGEGRDAISAGLWPMQNSLRPLLLRHAGLSGEVSENWLCRAQIM